MALSQVHETPPTIGGIAYLSTISLFIFRVSSMAQGQFGYQKVQLIKTKPLGTGSYGAVYMAMCDDLPCAGKILHPTLFQSNDPGAMTVMKRFQQECSFLSAIRHPNIVQYLGSYEDPESQLPVLLMELMRDNLTQFLERSQEPLSFHIQVNICHDIALALAYLHANDIIHRDLSSNNVLVVGAGNKAKITDFGMAKLFDLNRTNMTPLTMCPGTLAYMSPEVLDNPPVYTKKLDSFSFGVLNIQIVTQQFPTPGPRSKKVKDSRSPTGRIDMPVLEIERRKSHISLINLTHPLLPIATDCLSFNEEDRPSAQELCYCLAAVKKAPQYGDSVLQAQERSRLPQSTTEIENRERQIRELQQEKEERDEQIQELQQRLQITDDEVGQKDLVIAETQREIQKLQQVARQKDCEFEARERLHRQLNKQLAASERVKTRLQQNLLQSAKLNQELLEEIQHLQQQLDEPSMRTWKEKLTLKWKTCKAAPCRMYKGSATVHGRIAYFRPALSRRVHSYNPATEVWSTLPECPQDHFTLTVVNGLVTAVGGEQSSWLGDKITNTLLSFVASEGGRWKWVEHFPPMPTRRVFTAVVCSGKALVVAGGKGESYTRLTTVEVMDTDTLQWSTACSLPHPFSDATATVCGDRVYLAGGWDQDGLTKSVFTCSLSALLKSQTVKVKNTTRSTILPVWHTIPDLPVKCSTCIKLNGQLLAVGGYDSQGKNTKSIFSYNTKVNCWEVISYMPTPRNLCLVAVLPGNKLIVMGGMNGNGDTDKVEIATVQ